MSDEQVDGFGYAKVSSQMFDVDAAEVFEGKHSETLESVVILFVRSPVDVKLEVQAHEPFGFAMSPDQADALGGHLVLMASRAREKGLQPPAER